MCAWHSWCVTWGSSKLAAQVQFFPSHLGDFLAPLPGERQKLNDAAIGTTICLAARMTARAPGRLKPGLGRFPSWAGERLPLEIDQAPLDRHTSAGMS